MIPPSEPNLSMTALRAEERAISGSGTNLAVPKVQVPAPAQIAGQQVHLSVPAVQIAPLQVELFQLVSQAAGLRFVVRQEQLQAAHRMTDPTHRVRLVDRR